MPKVVEGSWGRFEGFDHDEKSQQTITEEQNAVPDVHSDRDMKLEEFASEAFAPIEEAVEENQETDVGAYTTLPYLQASLFATLLEDTITQLRILVECNNELRIIKCKTDWNYLLRNKYGVQQMESVDELENINPHNLNCDEYKIVKLDFDRQFATDVITATYIDLSLNKSFQALKDYVNAELVKFERRVTLAEEVAANALLKRELQKQLRVQRNHIKSVIYDADVKIDEWRTIVEDAVLDAECKKRYISNWQQARTEQHIQTIHDKEFVYSSQVEYYKQRSDYEQRVHSEVELLMNIKINEVLQKVEEWMAKYDKDMESIDLRIQIKKNDYQNMLEKRKGLEETIEDHDKIMKEWIHFKEEREKLRLYRERMNNCATIVQSWWRGLLVRKQLGPYKPPKKGKGAPPKKK